MLVVLDDSKVECWDQMLVVSDRCLLFSKRSFSVVLQAHLTCNVGLSSSILIWPRSCYIRWPLYKSTFCH